MAIKQLLQLIGDDIVISKLDAVQKKGEEALGSFNKSTPDLKVNIPDAKPIQDFSDQTIKLKDALHALRPIMQAAGIQFSEFGGLVRLASTSLVGLGVATAGAALVGLAKLEENAARTKGELADLFGSSAKGDQAFAALGKQANEFGTTVSGLAPGLESFQAALNSIDRTAQGFRALKEEDLPGAQLAKNAGALTEAYGNFIKVLRAGRLDQDQAEKSAKAFFDTLKEGGVVTSAALRNLPSGTINLLKEAFGQAGLSARQFFALADSGAISVESLEKALVNFGPQAQQAFDTKAIKSFSDEFSRILTTLSSGFKSLSGGGGFSDFIIGELKRIREGIQATIVDLQRLKQIETASGSAVIGKTVTSITNALKGIKPSEQGFDEAGFIAMGDAIQKLPPKFIDANNSLAKLGAAGANMGQLVSKAADLASASIQRLRDAAKTTGDELQSVIMGSTEFKGRLDQIAVSRPLLAGEVDPAQEAIKDAAAAAKAFRDNPFFKDGVGVPITPVVLMDKFQEQLGIMQLIASDTPIAINPVIPTEAQQLLVQQFAETGNQAGTDFSQGLDLSTGLSKFQSLYQSIVSLFATPIPINFHAVGAPSLQSTEPFAGGGMVRGPGSGTSDSILAWLSNREYVVNARAVSHYGADLFAALNAMRLPRDFIGGFSMGGLARAISGNRFAAGGQVSAGHPVVLNIDRHSFNMSAGGDTIAQLKRFAVSSQLSSTGRKPRWVK